MKIVVLDGYTENPGDLSWDALKELGEVEVYDRTSYEESPLIAERIGDAEIVVINKTPVSRETMDKCENIKLIAVLATGYNVVENGGTLSGGYGEAPSLNTAYSVTANVTADTYGLKEAVKNENGTFTTGMPFSFAYA